MSEGKQATVSVLWEDGDFRMRPRFREATFTFSSHRDISGQSCFRRRIGDSVHFLKDSDSPIRRLQLLDKWTYSKG